MGYAKQSTYLTEIQRIYVRERSFGKASTERIYYSHSMVAGGFELTS